MTNIAVGVIGATSMVGHYALTELVNTHNSVIAYSRSVKDPYNDSQGVSWFGFSGNAAPDRTQPKIESWLCFCPITALPDHFEMLERAGARKVVALSSTSRFTKAAGAAGLNATEIALSKQLEKSEAQFEAWASSKGINWVILRPTLIYDFVRDKNLRHIKHFISKAGFFPLLVEAKGLRQPVYAGDIANASIAVLRTPSAQNTDYNLSGGEALPYREMVGRIFSSLGREPKFYKVPMSAFWLALFFARLIPRYRHLSVAMAERMEFDMVFGHKKA
ncbi:MAG: SDR family oxidoreductase, partial [Candidatus Saccharibacteria bacterium]|nr:SDR family oxidoreductase [Rhodoferax sp.]